jgi:predicted transposase/invertase (TIGR01784 family)
MTINKDKNEENDVIVKQKERPLVSFDWAIKHLLRNKVNYDVLEGFLSELLGRPVKVASILESESNKDDSDDKFNRVDIVVEEENKEIILIELQFYSEEDYLQRMLYGTCKTLVEHINVKEKYYTIKRIYSVNIIYFNLGVGTDYLYLGKTYFTGVHNNDILLLSDAQRNILNGIEAGDIYPQYYILQINKFNSISRDTLDEWFYFLKHNEVKEGFSAKGLLKAYEVMDYNRLSPEEKAKYDYEQDRKSRHRSMMASMKDNSDIDAEKKFTPIIEEMKKEREEDKKALEEKDRKIEEDRKAIEELKRLVAKLSQDIAESNKPSNIK